MALTDGRAFPGRDYILFITFSVILTTLVLQGLSLPVLIRRLGVGDDGLTNLEERTARLKANEAALAYLAEVETDFPPEVYASNGGKPSDGLITPFQRLEQEGLDVERRTIIQLRNEYAINDEALRRIQVDLDHAEARLHVRE